VPYVGNLDNANHCDALGLQSNVDRHPVTQEFPALTRWSCDKLFHHWHVVATRALWQDWFSGGNAIF
jgi:hypothetical protein